MATRKIWWNIGDLVVMNTRPDAIVYRITAIDKFKVALIERAHEGSNFAEQYVDISMLKPLSIGQIRALA